MNNFNDSKQFNLFGNDRNSCHFVIKAICFDYIKEKS